MASTLPIDVPPTVGPWRAAPAAVLGLGLAAGAAPLGWTPLALVALALLFLLETRCETPGGSALTGWAAGAAYFGGSMFWIVEPFFVDPWRHGWMAPFALILLPGGLALFWTAAFWLTGRLGRGWTRPFFLAVFLGLAEMLRGHVLTGFPWSLVGHVWIGTTQMQMAALIGSYGMTFVTLLAAAACTVWVGRNGNWLLAPALGFLVLAGADIFGSARLRAADPPPHLGATVRVVQPNIAQALKWDAENASRWFDQLVAQTAAPHAGRQPDVVIWPETALPFLLNGSEELLARVDHAAEGYPVILGAVRRESGRLYNSMVVVGTAGEIVHLYDKSHLTPFGEYMPFGELLSRFGIHGLAASEGDAFTAGSGPELLRVPGAGRVQPLICYEAIFPASLRTSERGDWIVQITNDAWFGEISGPYQHLAQARLRAVETGLPLIRAANTGISAVIDAKGRVVAALPLGVDGQLDAAIPPALPATLYSRIGDWPTLAAILAMGALLLVARPRESD